MKTIIYGKYEKIYGMQKTGEIWKLVIAVFGYVPFYVIKSW